MSTRALLVAAVLTTAAHVAHAAPDDVSARSIVFARGSQLLKADARGKSETALADLPDKRAIRALRTDALGKVLIADLGGSWWWLPLDGSTKQLAQLPCGSGPAQLSNDGSYVLCRAQDGKTGSVVYNVKSGKTTPVDVPTAGARLTGSGNELRVVWADGTGVWSAVPPQKKQPTKVAPEAPLRSFLVSPDGTHAVGVYKDEVYESVKKKVPAEILMIFPLDGSGARRKSIQAGVPLEWSHDSQWILMQDKNQACITRASGGQYKCWRGYTAVAIAPDGKYALLFGSRDLPKPAPAPKPAPKTKAKKGAKAAKPAKKAPPPSDGEETPEGTESEPDVPDDVGGEDGGGDDVAVPPPGGPVALYRAELEGAFTKSPQLVTRDASGAAVWVP